MLISALNEKKYKIIVSAIYLIVVASLAPFIHGKVSASVNYASCFSFVIFNFAVSLLFARKSIDFLLTTVALFATIFADRILIYNIEELIPLGVAIFTFAQISYFLKSFFQETSRRKRIVFSIALPVLIIASIVAVWLILGIMEPLIIIALIYFCTLLSACAFAFSRFKANPLLALGLLLFIGCDVVLGLQVLSGMGFSVDGIFKLDCWWFYYPSQILIMLSIFFSEDKTLAKIDTIVEKPKHSSSKRHKKR